MGVVENRMLLAEQGIHGFLRKVYGEDYVRTLPIALAHFCFRNGPVEDMHAAPEVGLTDEHMKTLNKYMVDKLGLFVACLACEDERALVRILTPQMLYGSHWDSPDLYEELLEHGFNPKRLEIQKRLLDSVNLQADAKGEADRPRLGGLSSNDAGGRLEPCPYCGSEILECKDETRLAHYIDHSDLGTNRAVAKAAEVPVGVVSDLQHCVKGKISETRKRQAKAVADCLHVPPEELFSRDPYRSKVRCLECGATTSLSVWNMRA